MDLLEVIRVGRNAPALNFVVSHSWKEQTGGLPCTVHCTICLPNCTVLLLVLRNGTVAILRLTYLLGTLVVHIHCGISPLAIYIAMSL